MASTYTDRLRLEKQANGENDTTWGTKINTVLDLIEDAISGMSTVATTGGSTTLSTNNSASDQARMALIKVTGVLVSNATIVVPSKTKQYLVWNATSGSYTLTVKTAAGASVVVAQGKKELLMCDATDVLRAHDLRAADGAALVLIDRQAVSGVAAVDFVTGIDSTYDEYELRFDSVGSSADDDILMLRISVNAGGAWKSGVTDYYFEGSSYGGTSGPGVVSALGSQLKLTVNQMHQSSGRKSGGIVRFNAPSDAAQKAMFAWTSWFCGPTDSFMQERSVGTYNTIGAINGVRLLALNGNLTGNFALYGVRKT